MMGNTFSDHMNAGCAHCGALNDPGSAFCGACGNAVTAQADGWSWLISIPMVTDRFILYDLGKMLAWTGVIIAVLMLGALAAFGPGVRLWEDYINLMKVFALVLPGLGLFFLLIMIVFFGNRYRMGFTLDDGGVGWTTMMSRVKWANRLSVAAGLLAGRPGVAGAGLLAQSQEAGEIEWNDIARLKFYPRLCVISVMNSWRVVLRLYCTPENYEHIAGILKRRAAKAVIQTLAVVAALLIAAPASIAGQKAQSISAGFNLFNEKEERAMGERYARQLDSKLKLVGDGELQRYVDRVAARLVAVSPRPDVRYRFRIVNTREVNAFAVPGGFIYINRGLIELAGSEDEMAGVLAHEIGHVAARHGTKQLSKQLVVQGILLGAVAAAGAKSKKWSEIAAVGGGLGMMLASMKYSRNDEYQADALARQAMLGAGYKPEALVRFFERMDESSRRGSRAANWLAIMGTHPPMAERIKRAEKDLGPVPAGLELPAGREFTTAKAMLAKLEMPRQSEDVTLASALRAVGLAERTALGAASSGTATAAAGGCGEPGRPVETKVFRVKGNTVWMGTGVNVFKGDWVEIEATGEILPVKNSDIATGPDGLPGTGKGFWKPLSWADTGALLARFESGGEKKVVVAGGSAMICVPFGSEVEFGINDDNNFDNRGEFEVRLTVREGGRQ